ncbi:mitogen-activated protein kinase kinase kinase 17 [Momordica charantia]|uniref:Mitogen-activated protein kinase kinase kinase 17 n=1 Tax=Momordica charantia TaxID=3673 RepID=A0A6J1E3D1_MOMCH|nr:mitogen-activated protein kinase kinase kinase 17 [Momordica charantia]
MAPEMARENDFDWPIDIWAVGCVVLEMLTGKGVWSCTDSDSDLLALIGYSEELPEIPSRLSAMAKDFLGRCLVRSPYARSPAWLLLHHPFISL